MIFEKIKGCVSFESVARDHGIEFDRSNKALCSFHSEKTPSFHNFGTHGFCFGCGKTADAIDIESHFTGLKPFEAAQSLAKRYGFQLPEFSPKDKERANTQAEAHNLLTRLAAYANKKIKQHPEALEFLRMKGIDAIDIDRWQLGFIGDSQPVKNELKGKVEFEIAKEIGLIIEREDGSCYDYFQNRIIIPVWNTGSIVYLTGRAFPEGEPKYLHLKNTELIQKQIAFSENLRKEKCVIVEGVTDAIAFNKVDVPSCGLLGTNLGERVKQSLTNAKAKLYFCMDNDEAGQAAAYRLAKEFREYVIDLGYEEDPDQILAQEGIDKFKEIVGTAINGADSYLDLVIKNETVRQALLEISKLELESDKDIWLKKLSLEHGVTLASLRKDILKIEAEEEVKIISETSKDKLSDPLSEFSEEEIQKAKQLLNDPELLKKISAQIEATGYIGEEINKKLLYLSFTSRLFNEAISNVIKGESSSGKSSLVKAVLSLFPKSVYKEFTSITPQALYYLKDIDLSHRILVIFEAHGSEKADYPIRSSISEGELRLLVTSKNADTGAFESREIVIPARGLSYVETTTKSKLNPENQTRLFDLYLDTSEEQTRKVLLAKTRIQNQDEIQKENRVYQALQLLLEPSDIYIPYAEFLAQKFPVNKVRTRRDFVRFLTLIKVICLLYQYQREKTKINGKEFLIATAGDYKIAYELSKVILSQTLKEITPRQERVINAVQDNYSDIDFAIRDLKTCNSLKNIADSTLRDDVYELTDIGCLDWNGEKGKNSRYKLTNVPKDFLTLPSPGELAPILDSLLAQSKKSESLQADSSENKAIAQSSSISSKEHDSAIELDKAKNRFSSINDRNSSKSLDNELLSYSANENMKGKIEKIRNTPDGPQFKIQIPDENGKPTIQIITSESGNFEEIRKLYEQQNRS